MDLYDVIHMEKILFLEKKKKTWRSTFKLNHRKTSYENLQTELVIDLPNELPWECKQ